MAQLSTLQIPDIMLHLQTGICRDAAMRLLDEAESIMAASAPVIDFPVEHLFTPGLYTRVIFMPAGSLLTSKIHKTQHPFTIMKGRVSVWTKEQGIQHLEAPHFGITEPDTRRLLYVHEDTVWMTYHSTKLTDVAAIEAEIIEPHHNLLLTKKEDELWHGQA